MKFLKMLVGLELQARVPDDNAISATVNFVNKTMKVCVIQQFLDHTEFLVIVKKRC